MKKSESQIGLGLIDHELQNIRGRQRRRVSQQRTFALQADSAIKQMAHHLKELKHWIKEIERIENRELRVKQNQRSINREVGTNIGLTGIFGKL